MSESPVISPAELAELLGVKRWTIDQNLRETGQAIPGVPAIKVRTRWVIPRSKVYEVLGVNK